MACKPIGTDNDISQYTNNQRGVRHGRVSPSDIFNLCSERLRENNDGIHGSNYWRPICTQLRIRGQQSPTLTITGKAAKAAK